MLLPLLVPVGQVVQLFTLVLALYLTVIELREWSPRPHWSRWIWWLLFVGLTHFVGYLILRGYVAYRRRNRAHA